jgi:hypothetical protein
MAIARATIEYPLAEEAQLAKIKQILSQYEGKGQIAGCIMSAMVTLYKASSIAHVVKENINYGIQCFKQKKYAISAPIIMSLFSLLENAKLLTVANAKLYMQYVEEPTTIDDDFLAPERELYFSEKICILLTKLSEQKLFNQSNYKRLLSDVRFLKEFLMVGDYVLKRTFLFNATNPNAVANMNLMSQLDPPHLRYVSDRIRERLGEDYDSHRTLVNARIRLKEPELERDRVLRMERLEGVISAMEQKALDEIIRNMKTRITQEYNTQRVTTVISFFKANQGHPFVQSIHPLVNGILEMTGMKEPKVNKK